MADQHPAPEMLLPDSLWKFIEHDTGCALHGHWMEASDHGCTCGLEGALDELKAMHPRPSANTIAVDGLLWLWRNFVDGKPEYWAFDNAFPCEGAGGDPLVIGQPCGYAIFKRSVNGRPYYADERVLSDIAAALASEPPQTKVVVPGDVEREDRAFDQTIAERDQAEEALARAFTLVTGREPEWSNLFGFDAALREIEETVAALTRPATDTDTAMVERVEHAIELRRYLFGGEPLNPNERSIVEGLRTAVLDALTAKAPQAETAPTPTGDIEGLVPKLSLLLTGYTLAPDDAARAVATYLRAALRSPAPVQGDRGELIERLNEYSFYSLRKGGNDQSRAVIATDTLKEARDALTADAALIASLQERVDELETRLSDKGDKSS